MGRAATRLRREQRRQHRLAEETILHRLVEVAPKHIDDLARRTTIECIEAAVIGLLVLRRLGIRAVERPVAVDALNAPMVRALHEGRDPATFTNADGMHVVSMGHAGGLRTPTQWEGHLIIWTESGWLVDLWPTSRQDVGLTLPLAYCLPAKTLPATYSMPDGALVRYEDKPENVFYQLALTWPDGYPEWQSTIDAIVEEVNESRSVPRGASFTRCPDPGIREYAEAVFSLTPPEHVWDAARVMGVQPERTRDFEMGVDLIGALMTRNAAHELAALEAQRIRHELGQ